MGTVRDVCGPESVAFGGGGGAARLSAKANSSASVYATSLACTEPSRRGVCTTEWRSDVA